MFGYYFRREDETPGVVADAAFAAFIQLFIPFPYNEPDKNFKKSLYFFIDRELFGYTDVISLSFCAMEGAVPVEVSPSEALIYRFATAYFLHCMVNRKLSSCKSEFNELTGSDPDAYLLDELFKAANNCCNNHAVQKWLIGTSYATKEGKYLRNSFLKVPEATKTKVFEAARSCRFTLRDLSGQYEYSWIGVRRSRDSICIELNIKHPLEEYAGYKDMVKGLLANWSSRIFESFRDEILKDYVQGLDEKEKEKLAVRCGNIDISDISFSVKESFYWKLLGLKGRNSILSQRFASDLELMLYTLSVGENLRTYEQLRGLRDAEYKSYGDIEKKAEIEALEKTLLGYLVLGPERYQRALEQLKDLLNAGGSTCMLWVSHDKVRIPNMPRMVLIIIALDRYTGGLADIRCRLEDMRGRQEDGGRDEPDKLEELICKFRRSFVETEVRKLRLITKEELEMLLDHNFLPGGMRKDLEDLRDTM